MFIREQIAALPREGIGDFYKRTKPDIRLALDRSGHFLSGRRQAHLNRLWYEYEHIPEDSFNPNNEGLMEKYARELHEMSGEPFQSPYDTVRHYLEAFCKFSA